MLSRLVRVCPQCEEEWLGLGALGGRYVSRLREALAEVEVPPCEDRRDELAAGDDEIAGQEALVAELRRRHTRVLEEKSELLRTPPHRRVAKIRHARRRFRSCLLAEMLLAECFERVRCAPREAAQIAALVEPVLAWADERSSGAPLAPSRVDELRLLAVAHHANALRVAGELPAASRLFEALRRREVEARLPAATQARIDSLEASLRSDQNRYSEAESLLERTADAYRRAGDGLGLARVLIKWSNLMRSMGRPQEMVPLLDEAAEIVDPEAEPYLHLCIVTGRVNVLCEVGRFAEADRLLRDNLDRYCAGDDPHLLAGFRCLEGRVALGLGDLEVADASFAASQAGFVRLGRTHDAAHVAMLRAHALRAAGETAKLRRLAARLIPVFQRVGVADEALRAFDLLDHASPRPP